MGSNYGGPAQGFSKRVNISNWARYHSCVILAKNVAVFCSCPTILPEAKRVIEYFFFFLVKKISRQFNIDSLSHGYYRSF